MSARTSMIRLAASHPKGSDERKAILAVLVTSNWEKAALKKLKAAESALQASSDYLDSQGITGEAPGLVEKALALVGKAMKSVS